MKGKEKREVRFYRVLMSIPLMEIESPSLQSVRTGSASVMVKLHPEPPVAVVSSSKSDCTTPTCSTIPVNIGMSKGEWEEKKGKERGK